VSLPETATERRQKASGLQRPARLAKGLPRRLIFKSRSGVHIFVVGTEINTAMFSLNRPLGRIPFVIGTSFVDSVLLLATLLAFAFMPSGNGHIGVLIIMAALMGWWFGDLRRQATGSAGRWLWPRPGF
jgi:hypothetical protein